MAADRPRFDRLLAAVAPALAASRARNRLEAARSDLAADRIAEARRITASYDAAQAGRRTQGWRRVGSSQNAEGGPALHKLRDGARELIRNDPFASRSPRIFAAHLVGRGVMPRAMTEDPALRASLADKWARFVETSDAEGRLDFYGQQRLLARTVFESGEALLHWTPRAQSGGLGWTAAVLEPDFIDTGKTGQLGENYAIQGVEFDRFGRRVAYWLFDRHPGDRFGHSGATGGLISRRVLAEFVDHVFDPLRPGQVRGVPWLAPVALTLLDLKDLAEAELVRKKLEACITGVVTSPELDEAPTVGEKLDALKDGDGAPVDRMSPGMWLHATAGYGVEFHAPAASEGLVEHMRERLHAVAAGVGLTYHQLTGDLTQANYSSVRTGLVEFRQMLDGWQADLMVQPICRPAWTRVQGSAAPRARYIPPARPWIDPAKDIAAKISAINNYLESPQDVIASQGDDADEQLDEHKAWIEGLAARGLTLPATPGAPAAAPAKPEQDEE